MPITRLADIFLVRVPGGQFFCLVIWKIMSPKFLLIAHVYFTDQKYRKTVISHYMTTCSPDDSYFRVTMKLLMAQSHNTDFLNAFSVKVQDIMLTSTHLPYIFFLSSSSLHIHIRQKILQSPGTILYFQYLWKRKIVN